MKKVLLLALVFSLSAVAARAQSPSAEDYFKSSRAHMQRAEFAAAIADLDKALALKPDFTRAYFERSGARLLSNDLDGALADINKTIELDPNFKPAYITRAHIRSRKGDYDGALADYDKSIALGWLAYESYVGRGNVKIAKHDLDGAVEEFNAAIALDPKSPQAYLARARARREKGDSQGATSDLTAAAELGVTDPASVYPNPGATNSERGGGKLSSGGAPSQTAEKRFETVYALPDARITANGATTQVESPLSTKLGAALALSNRGGELMMKGDADGAIKDYTKSIEIYPTSAAYLNRSAALREKGDKEGALADINKAIELAPSDASNYYQRAGILLDMGRTDEAKKDLEHCLKLDPSFKPMVESLLSNAKKTPPDR